MFKILNISLYTLSTIIFLSLNINIALSQKQYSKEEIIKNARTILQNKYGQERNCFYLQSIKLEEAGFITLHFKHNNIKVPYRTLSYHKNYCPENVLYDVKAFKTLINYASHQANIEHRTCSLPAKYYVAYVGTFAAMSERASAPPFSSSVMKVSRMSEAKAALVKLFF